MIVPYLGVQETLRRSSDVAMAAPAGQGRWMQSTVGFGGYPEPWTASKGPGFQQRQSNQSAHTGSIRRKVRAILLVSILF